MIVVTIPGKPMGEPRAAHRVVNGFARKFVPKASQEYRAIIQTHVAEAMKQTGAQTFVGPVMVYITALFELPKSKHKKKHPPRLDWCTKKPDTDNIAKIVCDALNGVAWMDDSQVVTLNVAKYMLPQGRPSSLKISIYAAGEANLPVGYI